MQHVEAIEKVFAELEITPEMDELIPEISNLMDQGGVSDFQYVIDALVNDPLNVNGELGNTGVAVLNCLESSGYSRFRDSIFAAIDRLSANDS
jgi:hypothetical protein